MRTPDTDILSANELTEDELEPLFRLSLDMLCIAGLDGFFKRVNPAFEKTLGHGIDELLSRPFLDFVHPDDRDATLQAMSALARGETVSRFENRYRCRDHSWRWLSWTAVTGGHERIYAVASDVTVPRLAAEALRQSHHRYRQLFEAVVTYSYSVEVAAGVACSTIHNPGVFQVTGFAAEELVADPYLWFRMIHPEDREWVQDHLTRVLAGEAVPPFEHRIFHRDGTVRWMRDTLISHRGPAGELIRYDGVIQDITEQKRVEERFRLLVEFAPDAIVVTDDQGRIVHVNRKTEELFGYDRAELMDQKVEMLIPQRLRERHEAHRRRFTAAPAGRNMGNRPDLACRRKDGREFAAEISLSAIGEGAQMLIYSSIRDVTELRAAQARILDNEAQAHAAQRIQQRLLPVRAPRIDGFDIAGASHPAALTGGDLFDFLPFSDGTLGMAVGDVSGHGIAAALIMSSTHAYLRLLATTCSDVGDILARANHIIAEEIEDTRFVTLFLACLNPRTRSFCYTSAGHPNGYLMDESGTIQAQLASTSLPLGISPDASFPSVGPLTLPPGSLLLALTDGVLDAFSPEGLPFGVERVLETVRAHRRAPAAEIIDNILRAATQFTGRIAPDDDMTIVIVKSRTA